MIVLIVSVNRETENLTNIKSDIKQEKRTQI